MLTCSMCMPVSVKNVPANCGTFFMACTNSGFNSALPLGGGKIGIRMPSEISFDHSAPCSSTKPVPKAIVASSQLRVHVRSLRLDAITASTMVRSEEHTSELQSPC